MKTATSITIRVPLTIRRQPGRKTVVTPVRGGGETALQSRADPALVKALARAFRYQRLLNEGRYASISEMAVGERVERGFLGTVLRMSLLAPDLVEAILNGRQPAGATLSRLAARIPAAWASQRAELAVIQGGSESGGLSAGHAAAAASSAP